jgi:outer membrane putative beta-barrel porin/alpha-amylase
MRWLTVLLAASLLAAPVLTAAEEEPDIEFFYPVVTRRPVIERELEFKVTHEKGQDGRRTDITGGLEYAILPWWQIEIEVPFVINDPRDESAAAGFGDVELQNKFLLYKSVQHRALVAAGFEVKLPSGSQRHGLGGEAAIEPFVTAGIALGPFDVLADISYEWALNSHVHGQREQELSANLGLGYPASRWFTPFLEVGTVVLTSGSEEDVLPLRDRPQLYLTPGFNVRPLPGMTFRAGIQLPVTSHRQFDYAIHAGLVWEF